MSDKAQLFSKKYMEQSFEEKRNKRLSQRAFNFWQERDSKTNKTEDYNDEGCFLPKSP